MSDKELAGLIVSCRTGDRNAQYRIYKLFYNYCMSISMRYAESNFEAEEIVNDAFYKAFTRLHLYGGELSFKAWLRRITVNTSIDYFRARQRQAHLVALTSAPDPGAEMDIIEQLTKEQMLQAMSQLSPGYRTVFNLFVVDGYSHEEIAEMLNISVGTSKSNLARARQKLKDIFYSNSSQKKTINS
jgi:RNA polymerase sigma factor (sigma-70 family)